MLIKTLDSVQKIADNCQIQRDQSDEVFKSCLVNNIIEQIVRKILKKDYINVIRQQTRKRFRTQHKKLLMNNLNRWFINS